MLETLTVFAILSLLLAIAVPAFSTIQEAHRLASATSRIATLLEQGRAYAMAQNTHVYVALKEIDSSQDPHAIPQKPGVGRVAILLVASRDGTSGYDFQNPEHSWASRNGAGGANLSLIGKLELFENLHMAASLGATPESGPMGVEAGRRDVGRYYRLGHPACRSVTPIQYPLGSDPEKNAVQYYFDKVIHFDPHGIARIQYASNADEVKAWMEIGLEITRGNLLPKETLDPSRGLKSAIQIDCMTGSVRVYKP